MINGIFDKVKTQIKVHDTLKTDGFASNDLYKLAHPPKIDSTVNVMKFNYQNCLPKSLPIKSKRILTPR